MKNDNSIIEGNKLINEFAPEITEMCRQEYLATIRYTIELKYHSSWDWLMPVVEKIHSTPAIIFEYTISLIPFCRIMYAPKNGAHKHFVSPQSNEITGIEAVYDCVVQFIQWYNQTKIKTNEQ